MGGDFSKSCICQRDTKPKGMQPWVGVRLSLWYLWDSWVEGQKLYSVVWLSGQRSELKIQTWGFPCLKSHPLSTSTVCLSRTQNFLEEFFSSLLCPHYLTLLCIPVFHSIPWSFKTVFCPSGEEVNLQLPNLNTDNSEERLCQECPCIHPTLNTFFFSPN